jgi:hypothetical protein
MSEFILNVLKKVSILTCTNVFSNIPDYNLILSKHIDIEA